MKQRRIISPEEMAEQKEFIQKIRTINYNRETKPLALDARAETTVRATTILTSATLSLQEATSKLLLTSVQDHTLTDTTEQRDIRTSIRVHAHTICQ